MRRFVSLREQFLGLRSLLVDLGRLSATVATAYRTSLPHNAIALVDGEMRADGIVRKTQHPGKVLDGAPRAFEQRDHPPSRAFKELLVPVPSQ